MAEGYLRRFAGEKAEVFSAGVETRPLNERAVKSMKDDGIDISHHTSKLASTFDGARFDFVITVCDNAREQCPYFPGSVQVHHDFPDPTDAKGTEQEIENAFRETRNLIRKFSRSFVEENLR